MGGLRAVELGSAETGVVAPANSGPASSAGEPPLRRLRLRRSTCPFQSTVAPLQRTMWSACRPSVSGQRNQIGSLCSHLFPARASSSFFWCQLNRRFGSRHWSRRARSRRRPRIPRNAIDSGIAAGAALICWSMDLTGSCCSMKVIAQRDERTGDGDHPVPADGPSGNGDQGGERGRCAQRRGRCRPRAVRHGSGCRRGLCRGCRGASLRGRCV